MRLYKGIVKKCDCYNYKFETKLVVVEEREHCGETYFTVYKSEEKMQLREPDGDIIKEAIGKPICLGDGEKEMFSENLETVLEWLEKERIKLIANYRTLIENLEAARIECEGENEL